jgi:hypothetical protein
MSSEKRLALVDWRWPVQSFAKFISHPVIGAADRLRLAITENRMGDGR